MYKEETIRAKGAKGEGITDKRKDKPSAHASDGRRRQRAKGPTTAPRLTPRQMDVLRLVARGHSNKRIARVLGLAEGTVKLHVAAVLKTLGVSNRTQAVVAATALGLIGAFGPGTRSGGGAD